MNQENAEKILLETEQGYDLISNKFSQTRKHFWRNLEFIGEYTKKGGAVLDFGCGNGRLLELFGDFRDIKYFGVDVSQKLVDAAKEKYLHPVKSVSPSEIREAEGQSPNFTGQGGAEQFNRASFSKIDPLRTTLPFANDYFNAVYSIAVFHHFPSEKYREDLARELYRITKKDGHVIITVWNLWQRKYFKNILRNWFNKFFSKSEINWNDCYISFTDNTVHPVKYPQSGSAEGGFNGASKFQRFHHAFTKSELKKLFKNAGYKIEKCEIIKGRNILLVGKKL